VRFSIKMAVLSAILVADLSFFLFLRTHFPQAYELVFEKMPWPDNLEKTFIIIIGLMIATVTSLSIAYSMIKRLLKSIQRG
jgi:uncharacterized protein YacL